MKGIAEHDLRANGFELVRCHGLDRAIGAYGHESGGLDLPVRQSERAATGKAVSFVKLELHVEPYCKCACYVWRRWRVSEWLGKFSRPVRSAWHPHN
ncbi:hypothetical protein GALL_541450 [mine drainage metagenome]|uniref:Uncharacterized protein n=1 Tax=mine drainage metagenome TaxID=410659 RepID=A0A1J5NYG2_9ZZZZ